MARLSKKKEELLKAVQKQVVREQTPSASLLSSASAVGLGVDLLEIERMEQAIKRTPRILERVFTSGEREYAWSKARPAVYYAMFFAARGAVLKSLGDGPASTHFRDVEITYDERGKPEVVLHGETNSVARQQGITEIQISLTYTHQVAVASAVALNAQSSPRKPETLGPMEELAIQFKELRSMLDDLGVSGIIDDEDAGEPGSEEEPVDKEADEATPVGEEASVDEEADETTSIDVRESNE